MAYTNQGRSIPEVFSDIVTQFGTLLRTEGQLARAEISENISKAGNGLVMMVIGAVLLIPALVVLMQALVVALVDQGFSTAGAALLTGGIVLIVGVILLMVGASRMKPARMVPSRTINQLQRDASVAQDQMRQKDDLHRAA
jgi:uncharacterized membrane protein YqjE